MQDKFDITAFDAEFAARMDPAEWARIVKFRSLPQFLDGVRRHEGVMQPFFAHDFILNKVVAEIWRFQILVLILYLDATKDPADPRTGLTISRLHTLCGQLGIASPGRINSYVNIMRVGGYLTAKRSDADSRIVHYLPTPAFLETVETWNDNIWQAIDAADPAGQLSGLRARYPDIGTQMRISGAEGLLQGWVAMNPFPEVLHFATVDGGWLLLEHIIGALMAGGQGEGGQGVVIQPVRVKLGILGTQFGGSRSNLRRVLERGFELGLLSQPPRGGAHVVLSPRMICAFLTFLASFLGYFQQHTAIALARAQAGQRGAAAPGAAPARA